MSYTVEHCSGRSDEDVIREYLTEQLDGVLAIYLFGSHARAQATPTSDVDIAVLAAAPLTSRQRFDMTGELAAALNRDIDLIDLRTASAVLRIQIIGHGKALYRAGTPAVEAFEDFVFSDYARLNEERAQILSDVKARGSIYG